VRRTAIALISMAGISLTGLAGFIVLVLIIVITGSSLPGSGNIPGILQLLPGFRMLQACAPNNTTGSKAVQATAKADSIPNTYFRLYHKAGEEWNIPWNVLAGIGWVESHHGTLKIDGKPAAGVHYGENFKRAGGPMQFLQPTFDWAKVDGDKNGVKSRYDPDDAIFSAAKLLKLHIFPGASTQELKRRTLTAAELRKSIFAYNHSNVYVNDVLAASNRYYRGDYIVASANYAGMDCTALGLVGVGKSGPFGQRIADIAASYTIKEEGKGAPVPDKQATQKVFYSWGGGNKNGPGVGECCSPGGHDGRDTPGFDCSGLVQHAVYKASGDKINLSPPASAQWSSNKGVKVSRKQLAPGDLVFFSGLRHVAIYYGEFNGKRWMVEAPQTFLAPGVRGYVRFSDFDARPRFEGALRVTPPPGMKNQSPDTIRAMSPSGAGAGEGAM
jgi:hypothetical protein